MATDPELDRLARALTAATDTLNSQDFRDRQARYLKAEAELAELATSLEADEAAEETARDALTKYIAENYLEGEYTSAPSDDGLFETTGDGYGADNLDEFSTPRANGGLT